MPERMVRFDPKRLAIKRATGELVDAAGGPTRAAQFAQRVKRQQSYSDYSLATVDHFIPIDAAIELEEVTVGLPGWPHLTRLMCGRAGGTFVPLPVSRPSSADFHKRLAELATEYSDVSAGLLRALADGRVTAREVRAGDLVTEAAQLVAKAAELRALLEQIEVEG